MYYLFIFYDAHESIKKGCEVFLPCPAVGFESEIQVVIKI
jgi:hypothetical protein